MRIFGPVIQGLGTAIDLYQARHGVLSENVANSETPGYRARDLDFKSALARAFDRDGVDPAPEAPEAVVDTRAAVKVDGNSVDIDTEMARLSENALTILALSRILSRKFESLRTAIQGGGQ